VSFVDVELSGGFGNRLSKYAFARAYARDLGATLRTTPWQGDEIFGLSHPRMTIGELPKVNSYYFPDWDGKVDIAIQGDPQHQKHILYTRADVREWFKFTPAIEELLAPVPTLEIAAHLRWGDFMGQHGFICLTKESYLVACDKFGLDRSKVTFVSEEEPIAVPGIDPNYHWKGRMSDNVPGLGFLPDFAALCRAKILLRGPSTFSWWAGALGDHERVFSPDQKGLGHTGGRFAIQDVPFVEGNHAPITSWWEGHSELHLRES
jgi:hypothetical protein